MIITEGGLLLIMVIKATSIETIEFIAGGPTAKRAWK